MSTFQSFVAFMVYATGFFTAPMLIELSLRAIEARTKSKALNAAKSDITFSELANQGKI